MEESSDHQQDEPDELEDNGHAQEGHSGSVGPATGLSQLIDDLSCPICISLLRDPFVTSCGHTFCCSCLTTHLEERSTCPSCGQYLIKDHIYPNFLLSKMSTRAAVAEKRRKKPLAKQIEEDLEHLDDELSLPEVNGLLTCLWQKKEAMEKQESQVKMQLLLQFLHHARSEKTRKLRELHAELTTLDTDIQQVAAQAGPPSVTGTPRAPERSSDAELLRRRIAEGADRPVGAGPLPALPGFPAVMPRMDDSPGPMAGPSLAPHGHAPLMTNHHLMPPPPGLLAQDALPPQPALSPLLAALPPSLFNDPAAREPAQGLLNMPSLQSTLHTRPPAQAAPQAPAVQASFGQGPEPMMVRSPSLDTWGGPSAGAPRAVDAQALSGFHSGSWTPDNSMATSSHPPMSASMVASVTPQSTTPTVSSSERNSDSGAGAGISARPVLPLGSGVTGQPSAPLSADHSMAGEESVRSRKRRVVSQFEDLQACYLKLRKQGPDCGSAVANGKMGNGHASDPGGSASHARDMPNGDTEMTERPTGAVMSSGGLSEFSRMLSVFVNCSKLKVIAELPRASGRQPAAILSSIEFDRDRSMFATAGVSKRISLYSFDDVMEQSHVQHSPASELITRSKLSCLSWNKYVRNHLLSSDYEGCVTLWDVDTGMPVNEYEAHDKRIWSVDFCTADSSLFVSGSDDGWIKAWSTKQAQPTSTIELRANVCCVKYNPNTAHEIAVGSADHNVHLYDLRKSSSPVHVFSGHRKAVSYVRWLSDGEVVSASTDSTLRLWDIHSARESRVFRGHVNEKNFVGLAADSEFIACGSETNEVHVYYRALAKPIASKLFSSPSSPSEGPQFISAVCWKPSNQILLAANSQGCIKIMRLAS